MEPKLNLIKNQLINKGYDLNQVKKINQGKNSSTYKVNIKGKSFILKIYPENIINKRDRLHSELNFLLFLEKNKISNVPKAIDWDERNNWLLLTWLEGNQIDRSEINADHCKSMINFLLNLQKYNNSSTSYLIGNASEACFSIEEHLIHIKQRLSNFFQRINHLKTSDDKNCRTLIDFIENLYTEIKFIENIKNIDSKKMMNKIPSPSDVGFHNTLIHGNIMNFIDFEYAGWDDPTKLLSDLILQPEYSIPMKYVTCLDTLILSKLMPKDICLRMPLMLRLYRMKWVLIILNPIIKKENKFSDEIISTKYRKISSYWFESERRIICAKNHINKLMNK